LSREVLVSQGFYKGPISLPIGTVTAAGYGGGRGRCRIATKRVSFRIKALAMHASMLPSEQVQHTATHCNTLQPPATHCNALQRTATHCNALQRTATH